MESKLTRPTANPITNYLVVVAIAVCLSPDAISQDDILTFESVPAERDEISGGEAAIYLDQSSPNLPATRKAPARRHDDQNRSDGLPRFRLDPNRFFASGIRSTRWSYQQARSHVGKALPTGHGTWETHRDSNGSSLDCQASLRSR